MSRGPRLPVIGFHVHSSSPTKSAPRDSKSRAQWPSVWPGVCTTRGRPGTSSTSPSAKVSAPSALIGGRLTRRYPQPLLSTQYVFSMYRLAKRYPPDKLVLENISISLLPGAKIGVLGYNGAGKSTLLRILAGVEQEFEGEA